MQGEGNMKPDGELEVSFGYQCNASRNIPIKHHRGYNILPKTHLQRNSSFSCLSGAALSANATLANTNICNGLFGGEILPSLDSPKSFRKVPSSPSLSRLDMLSSSVQSGMSNLSCSSSPPSEFDFSVLKTMSAPSRSAGFLRATEIQVAGGAAGEDRVQAVCSEENGWLFCAIYDGFNGRDAADFLAGTLYESVIRYLSLLDRESEKDIANFSNIYGADMPLHCGMEHLSPFLQTLPPSYTGDNKNLSVDGCGKINSFTEVKSIPGSFTQGVLSSLQCALTQAENDFLYMVEQEMDERPDLVSIGSCVLVVLLHGNDLYTLNLGDSRAVLASANEADVKNEDKGLKAIQLTDSHTVDNEVERNRLLREHPDDPMLFISGKVKGKLKVTRAFGVGYLKKKKLNDALMGILRVQNLRNPPYVSMEPWMNVHRISKSDRFVIVGSDGLFDFFNNDEAVELVHAYILSNPFGDPAKFLLEQLVTRAADCAGFSREELMNIPAGRRRKYHDDVTVIVIILGTNHRTSKASTCV